MRRTEVIRATSWLMGCSVSGALLFLVTVAAAGTHAPPIWPYFLCGGVFVAALVVWWIARRGGNDPQREPVTSEPSRPVAPQRIGMRLRGGSSAYVPGSHFSNQDIGIDLDEGSRVEGDPRID